jgi:hypothetical protein
MVFHAFMCVCFVFMEWTLLQQTKLKQLKNVCADAIKHSYLITSCVSGIPLYLCVCVCVCRERERDYVFRAFLARWKIN